ncbi:uncharacterized protein LOC133233703 [Bos javanicus]|uniref:uncharacterized protein LOC133233703 n=1 Tax=Bos javanicus TaxID=9906 RepID=UPI002AA83A91|nr:uncharacterized protein LOC133233703 [Bos javanicus]
MEMCLKVKKHAQTHTHTHTRLAKKKKNRIKGKGWPQKLVVWLTNKQTNTLGPVCSHLSLTPATISPDAPTWDGLSTFAVPWRKVRKQGPRSGADGWVEGLERLAAGRPRPTSSPAPHPWRPPPREPRGFPPESPCRAGSSVPAHPHLPRRAASRKAKLVASKGKNGSSEGSRKLEKHLQGVLWALCAKLSQAGTAAGETRMDTVVEKLVAGGASPGSAELQGRFKGNLTLRSW